MALKQDLDYQISAINELFADFIVYNDSIDYTDSNLKVYVTSDTLLLNTQMAVLTAVQELEKEKSESLVEYEFIPNSDTTLFNLCFSIYGTINETYIEQLIDANDLQGINRYDLDPTNPVIKKNTKIIYYK